MESTPSRRYTEQQRASLREVVDCIEHSCRSLLGHQTIAQLCLCKIYVSKQRGCLYIISPHGEVSQLLEVRLRALVLEHTVPSPFALKDKGGSMNKWMQGTCYVTLRGSFILWRRSQSRQTPGRGTAGRHHHPDYGRKMTWLHKVYWIKDMSGWRRCAT